ncbi:MAG: type I restriction endonuclease [Nitrospirota bacterium]
MVFEYNEDSLIEQPAIELFKSLNYDHQNCYHETFGKSGTLGRETPSDVVLIPRLKQSLIALNSSVSSEAINLAIEELTRDLLLPKLINGEIDVEGLDISTNHEVTI